MEKTISEEIAERYPRLELKSRLHFCNDYTYYSYLKKMFVYQDKRVMRCEKEYIDCIHLNVVFQYKYGKSFKKGKEKEKALFLALVQAYVDLIDVYNLMADCELHKDVY